MPALYTAESPILAEAAPRSSLGPVYCEIVRDFARLEELAPQWDAIWAEDPEAEVFQSFRWNRAWWLAFRDSVRLCAPVVFRGSMLIGILPLVERSGRIEFLGAPQMDYTDVVCADADTVSVLAASLAALQRVPSWREGVLEGIPAHSRIARHYRDLPASCRRGLRFNRTESAYTISLAREGADVLDRLADKHHLRRRQNKLDKSGQVTFRHLENIPEALDHLELFFTSQCRRRAVQGKSSASQEVAFRRLLQNLVCAFDLRDELHFGVLEVNGCPVAWHISFEANEKLVLYQQTFDIDAWDLAPGEGLLRYLLRFAKGRVHREFDFTRGDEPFKARFTNCERPVYTLYVERPGFVGRLRGGWRALTAVGKGLLTRVRAAAKAEKAVFEGWRRLRTRVQELRLRLQTGGMQWKALTDPIWCRRNVTLWECRSDVPTMSPEESSDLSVSPGSLGELVDFAQENPEVILPTEILGLRDRLKNGDRLLIARRGQSIEQAAWATTRSLTEDLALPAKLARTFEPGLCLYECWTASRAQDRSASAAVLAAFRRDASALGLPLRVCAQEKRRGVQLGCNTNDFQKLGSLRWLRVFGSNLASSADIAPRP